MSTHRGMREPGSPCLMACGGSGGQVGKKARLIHSSLGGTHIITTTSSEPSNSKFVFTTVKWFYLGVDRKILLSSWSNFIRPFKETFSIFQSSKSKMTVQGTMIRSEVCNSWCFWLLSPVSNEVNRFWKFLSCLNFYDRGNSNPDQCHFLFW